MPTEHTTTSTSPSSVDPSRPQVRARCGRPRGTGGAAPTSSTAPTSAGSAMSRCRSQPRRSRAVQRVRWRTDLAMRAHARRRRVTSASTGGMSPSTSWSASRSCVADDRPRAWARPCADRRPRAHLEARDLAGEHAVLDDGIGAGVEDQVDQTATRVVRSAGGGDGNGATRRHELASLGDPHGRRLAEERARRATTPAASPSERSRASLVERPCCSRPGERRPSAADAEVLTRGTSAVPPSDRARPPPRTGSARRADEGAQLRWRTGRRAAARRPRRCRATSWRLLRLP